LTVIVHVFISILIFHMESGVNLVSRKDVASREASKVHPVIAFTIIVFTRKRGVIYADMIVYHKPGGGPSLFATSSNRLRIFGVDIVRTLAALD
jgi:hypothetical protein